MESESTNTAQLWLFGFIIFAPLLSFVIRRRIPKLTILIFIMQACSYLVFENRIPRGVGAPIRPDLFLIFPALFLGGWMALRTMIPDIVEEGGNSQESEYPPPGKTICDQCGETFPSRYYLRSAGTRGYLCEKCRD